MQALFENRSGSYRPRGLSVLNYRFPSVFHPVKYIALPRNDLLDAMDELGESGLLLGSLSRPK